MERIFTNLAEGPFAGALLVWGIEAQHVYGSQLSEEDQQNARMQLRRVLRGYSEEKITTAELDPHWRKISKPDPDNPGERVVRDDIPPDEVNEFIDGLEKLVDDKNIPDEMYQVDMAGEMKEAVDSVLGEQTTPTEKSAG